MLKFIDIYNRENILKTTLKMAEARKNYVVGVGEGGCVNLLKKRRLWDKNLLSDNVKNEVLKRCEK